MTCERGECECERKGKREELILFNSSRLLIVKINNLNFLITF